MKTKTKIRAGQIFRADNGVNDAPPISL